MSRSKKIRLLEFLVIGVFMGVLEDLIAVLVATDSELNFRIVWIVLLVAVPFAFVSEIVVDHPRFWEHVFPRKNKRREEGGG